jgi:hypothetical protein
MSIRAPGVRLVVGGTHMRYILLCYDDAQAWEEAGPTAMDEAMQEAVQLTHQLKSRGQYLTAAPLHPASSSSSVRVRNGKRLVTDGPFAETREHLGGFYLIDVKDLNEAIGVAERHPGARKGRVEIRPLMDIPGLPADGK